MNLQEILKPELEKLVSQAKSSLNEVQKIALAQAWKILQLAIVATIKIIEDNSPELNGKDKKSIAMETLSKFYDSVFIVVNVPFVPNVLEPIIHKYIKTFLMVLVGSSIDAMVTTFRNLGIFEYPPVSTLDPQLDSSPKISDK
jgi:hypothetical protein